MSMRITNSMMIDTTITNINKGLLKLNTYNMQLGTNRKMVNLYDDPAGVLSSMTARLQINTLERYEAGVQSAQSWVDQSETALYDVNEILISIKESLIDAMSGTKNPSDLANIAVEIEELTTHVMQNLNAVVGDKYIFAGFNTTEPPFTVGTTTGAVHYNGINMETDIFTATGTPSVTVAGATFDAIYGALATVGGVQVRGGTPETRGEVDQVMEFEIGFEMNMDVTFTGIEIVGVSTPEHTVTDPVTGETVTIAATTSMFEMLSNLVADLRNAAPHEVLEQYLGELNYHRENVMEKIVEIGAKSVTLDMLETRYSKDMITYEQMRTEIEDIDQAETISLMKFAEASYQQALAVGARVIMPTLLDFLN